MSKELSLLTRLYFWPHFTEVARVVGYAGVSGVELEARLRPLVERFGRNKVEIALYALTTYMLHRKEEPVQLRADVREWCWQLLGPPPEQADAFYRHPDGTP